jgi:glycosyltransferase involved in cell wall biosynthesis
VSEADRGWLKSKDEERQLDVLLVYYEPIPAGQTTHVLSVARGLVARGHHVSVVLPADLERSIKAFQQAEVNVIPLPLQKLLWPLRSIFSLVKLVRSGPDIVHVHSQEAGLLGRAVAWMAGARAIVYTPQVIDIRRTRWHWLYVLVERFLARITDVIVSVSDSDRERMIRWGIPPQKIVKIPNSVDVNEIDGISDTDRIRKALGLDPERPLVMQVGRLSAQKNPLAFVEGAAQVLQKRPDAQFALVGEGPMREAITQHAETLGLNGALRLLGWRDNAAAMMTAADVVSLTSEWEGMPHTLLEAMAKSRPIVTTDVNGCPDVVVDGKTGFLVPPGDTLVWAERIIDLLENPKLMDKMGRRGRERVIERFSQEQMITCIEELYVGLVESC